jgi:large subunit ribosomal protein L34
LRLQQRTSIGQSKEINAMHYPHKKSAVKRARKLGFRARMRTKKGRQMISRKRRAGRSVQVV